MPLNVALGERGWVGETAVIEYVVSIDIERLQRENVRGQFDALFTLLLIPTAEVGRIVIGNIEPETLAVGIEVELKVTVFAHQLGWVQ